MATHGEVIELSQGYGSSNDGKKTGAQTSEVQRDASPQNDGLETILRVRKLFSGAQIFAFSLTYMSVWESMNS